MEGRSVITRTLSYRLHKPTGQAVVTLEGRDFYLGRHTSPSQAAIRAERKLRLQEALNRMDPIDREILVLRHYEQLSNGDVALVLGLDKSAASKRYARALVRLKDTLAGMPGGLQEP